MKLSDYAKQNSVCYKTAWNHFKKGIIPNAKQLPNGTVVIVDPKEQQQKQKKDYTILYARVNSEEDITNLETQMDKLRKFCISNGWKINAEIKECASGLDDKRPQLSKILKRKRVTRIIVENKDRLTIFGFNYIKLLCSDCDIVVIDKENENKEEIIEDFVSLITKFCKKIYSRKKAERKIEALLQQLKTK